tara:strand:+ start:3515 stop:4483 length:969 start_codon:yes stop_codon:yes gene_type:complete
MSKFVYDFLNFSLPLIFTYFFLKKIIPFLRKFIPANPSKRGMHEKIKPSSGGITFIMTYSFIAIFQGFYLPILSLPLALIGIIDDKYNISRVFRLIFQIFTIIFIIFYLKINGSYLINELSDTNGLLFIILIFFGAFTINSINFMDGIDGLICSSMIVIFATLNSDSLNLIPIIGSLFGFLYFNWFPSKVFMGDAGSLFLGSYLTSLIYSSDSYIDMIKIILLASPLLLDSSVCIIRRLINKQNIFTSHKLHLYQRLVSSGIDHSVVTLIYLFSIVFLAIFFKYTNLAYLFIAELFIIALGVLLDKNYATNFHELQINKQNK